MEVHSEKMADKEVLGLRFSLKKLEFYVKMANLSNSRNIDKIC